jgi:hypothetical protein
VACRRARRVHEGLTWTLDFWRATRSVEAVEKLITIMRDAAATHTAQIIAANSILDRGYGRPHQSVEMTGKDGDPIEHHEGSALEVIQSRLAAMKHDLALKLRDRLCRHGIKLDAD